MSFRAYRISVNNLELVSKFVVLDSHLHFDDNTFFFVDVVVVMYTNEY